MEEYSLIPGLLTSRSNQKMYLHTVLAIRMDKALSL